MKKFVSSALILLGALLLHPQHADASPFRIAGDYNVFVFGDIVQSGTDVEGRVAAGGNVTYTGGFSVASTIDAPSPVTELVAGHDVTLDNGRVGNIHGNIVYGDTASITGVGYGTATQGNPIDFAAEQSYLTSLSGYWGTLADNGITSVVLNSEISLTGTDPRLNIFTLQASDISQNIGIKFFAPEESTILVNILGSSATLMNLGFSFNGFDGENNIGGVPVDPVHRPDLYPYSHILFNFLNATDINIDFAAINGSILAPFADLNLGLNSHIDGQLIAASLSGNGESHNVVFEGDLPVPEPTSLALLFSGLVGLAAFRRTRRKS